MTCCLPAGHVQKVRKWLCACSYLKEYRKRKYYDIEFPGKMGFPTLMTIGIGVFVRIWLGNSPASEWLAETNEVSTPLTSWKRVTEGLSLYKAGVSPYSGDIFHEMPLMLRFLNYLNSVWGSYLLYIFIVVDVIVAIVLEAISINFGTYILNKQRSDVKRYSVDSIKMLLKADNMKTTKLMVVAVYLFNPYTIATCVSKSTAIFNNLFVALAVLYTLKDKRALACLSIAAASYVSLYPVMLVVPVALHLARNDIKRARTKIDVRSLTLASCVQTAICVWCALCVFLYGSYMTEGSWKFISQTYGFILTVPDLTPNIGVFWYFFTEMFEHFRLFFVWVFQINAFIYTVPLAIKLYDHPIFLMHMLIGVMSIFKSYPSYGDAALWLSLIPLWRHCVPYLRNSLVITVMYVVCSVMAPLLWHLWIYAGSANANFYFAITLVHTTAQVFLLTDLLFAFLRREYDLHNGPEPPVFDGKKAQIVLD